MTVAKLMRIAKWSIISLLLLTVFAVLHYTLPRHDLVRIVNTDVRRVDFGANALFWSAPSVGTRKRSSRDVRFIETIRPNGRPMVYRNEDTGWGWPPYFKFDSSNLQTAARDLISTKAKPQWVIVTRYGWRSEFLSIYPNAIALRAVATPDATVFPWVTIVVVMALLILSIWLWRMWLRLRKRIIEPMLEHVAQAWDETDARVTRTGHRVKAIWGRIRVWLARRGG